jgi:dsDNA-specific endonuclease/ATPase MutS2
MRLPGWIRRWLSVRRDDERVDEEPEHADPEDEDEVDPFNPFPEPVRIEIRDVFDLHTVAPQEMQRVVEEYLREARRMGFRSVRIIHGKGVGTQREMVRSLLARTPFVESWTDAPPEAGGWGATIAHLKPKDD